MRFSKLLTGASYSGLALMLMVPVAANAQSAPAPADKAAATDDTGQLSEIIVTAQRRGQNLQAVPLSVTAFNEKILAASGVTSIREISHLDPSLNISQASGVVVPFLRGVGNPSATTVGNEASVPVYIDDVYYAKLSTIDLELANVERVEVLKGPQGTLFGRNASGGAIQVFTRNPGNATEVEGSVGYANYDTFSGKLYVASPITDRIGASLSASGSHQGHGWGFNPTSGEATYKNKFYNFRGKIVADVTDTTKATIVGFINKQVSGQGLVNSRYQGTFGGKPPLPQYGTPAPVPAPGFYDSTNTRNGEISHRGHGLSAKIEQGLDFADLVSITAWRKAKESYYIDGDGTPFNFSNYNLNNTDRQLSEELQVKSTAHSSFDWIVGAFYLNSRQGYVPAQITGDSIAAAGGSEVDIRGVQTIKSLSGYGQATFHVIPDGTNITLGLRYTSDKVHGVGTQTIIIPGVGSFPAGLSVDDESEFHKLTYKVALDHKFADHVMGYVSFSRGYKSGTFNTLPLDSAPSRPETVDAYEVGLKSELFDRHVRLNVAVFQNDVGNPQVQTIIQRGTTSFVGLTNADKARSRGAEFNVDANLGGGFSIRGGGTYIDGKYTKFTNAPFYSLNPVAPFGLTNPVLADASGNRLAQVPKWRFNAGVNYDLDTEIGNFILDAGVSYTSRFFWDADNRLAQTAYALVNSSLTYHLPDNDRYSVSVWAKNLTKKKYYSTSLEVGGPTGYIAGPAAPRTFGIEFSTKI